MKTDKNETGIEQEKKQKQENQAREPEKKAATSQASDYEFIREQIKERPVNRKKILRRMLFTAGMAVLFATIACLTFLLLEPVFSKLLSSDTESELKVVSLPEQNTEDDPVQAVVIPEDDEEPEPLVIETPIENMSLNDEDVVSGNAAAESASENRVEPQPTEKPVIAGDTIIYETVPLEIEDYRQLYRKMYALSQEVEKSLVTVTGLHSDMDWMNDPYLSAQKTTGVIVNDDGYEMLILADSTKLDSAETLRVTFYNGDTGTLTVKAIDSDTKLGVYAIRLTEVGADTRKAVSVAVLGASYTNNLLGNAVMAVGSPLGSDSICYGAVTSTGNTVSARDAAYQLLTTDMQGDKNASGVIVNLRGQVVGLICHGHEADGMGNLIHAYGYSSIRRLIEDLAAGKVRPYLGLRISDVAGDVAKELGLPDGVYVEQIDMDSPAMAAGLAKGDLIQKIGDISVKSVSEYMNALLAQEAGTEVKITYARLSGVEYRTMQVTVELGMKE